MRDRHERTLLGLADNGRARATPHASSRRQGSVPTAQASADLLAAPGGSIDADIAANVAVGTATVYRTKRRFVEHGLEAALSEGPRPGADRKMDGREEALLIATACSAPPDGRARWTLDLLADAMVRLTSHESLSSETIRRRLDENE